MIIYKLLKLVPSIVILSLGIWIIIILYNLEINAINKDKENLFNDISQKYYSSINSSINNHLNYFSTGNILTTLIDFPTKEQFDIVANDILNKNYAIRAFGYAVYVKKQDRQLIESKAQNIYNDLSLQIFYPETNNDTIIKKPQIIKDWYMPLFYGKTKSGLTNFTLLDLDDDGIRKNAFMQIMNTCKPIFTYPTKPLIGNAENIIPLYYPYRCIPNIELGGVTTMSLDPYHILINSLGYLDKKNVQIKLVDITNATQEILLVNIQVKDDEIIEITDNKEYYDKLSFSDAIYAIDRKWQISIYELDNFSTSQIVFDNLIILGCSVLILSILTYTIILFWEKQQNQKFESDKFKHKEEFLNFIFNELRNPLNAIVMGITLLKNPPIDMTKSSIIRSIKSSAIHASKILDDVIDLEKISTKKFQIILSFVSVTEIVNSVYFFNISLLNKKKILFNYDIDDNLKDKAIYCDSKRIVQSINNFIDNSIKFTQEGGNITLNIKLINIDKPLLTNFITPQTSVYDDAKCILVEVIDNGYGIAEDEKKNIFISYEKAFSPSVNKNGLGLIIVKNLIELHHGKVDYESEFGKGSKFWFIIPYCHQTITESRNHYLEGIGELRTSESVEFIDEKIHDSVEITIKQPTESSTKGKSILIVDDNKNNLVYLRGILEIEGYNCDSAFNGEEAVTKIKNGYLYDLILMDNKMDKMSGLDATIQIMKLDPSSNIVGITGMSSKKDVDEFLSAGAKKVFTKPIDFDMLFQYCDEL